MKKFKKWFKTKWKNFKVRMVKILGGFNWKARMKNKLFLAAMTSTAILFLQNLGFDIPGSLDGLLNAGLTILGLMGVLTDPTSQGLEDYNAKTLKDEAITKIENDFNENNIPDHYENWYYSHYPNATIKEVENWYFNKAKGTTIEQIEAEYEAAEEARKLIIRKKQQQKIRQMEVNNKFKPTDNLLK